MFEEMTEQQAREQILEMTKEYCEKYHNQKKPYEKGDRIPYASRVYDADEMVNLVDSSLEFWLTSGRFTKEFESEFAKYLGVKYCSLVNSGSSANLLAFMALTSPLLKERQILPGDEVITFAPYFGEYRSYVNNFDGVLVEISPNTVDFQPKLDEFEAKITPKTKAVIVNTPNNPTGVVYSEETIRKMAEIMEKKQNEYGTEIYLISDEPYRELAYDGVDVPYLTRYYANTIVGYSYSKSLSLPGERIGYLVIPDDVKDSETLIAAANVANRILGFVNAPTLQQKVVARCLHEKTDISYYNRNRETLYQGLIECGFECVKPQGAFYLFMKTPIKDEKTFCQEAKKYNLLLVPGSSFGCAGYVRIAYCVAYETIVNALPKFKELAKEYQLG